LTASRGPARAQRSRRGRQQLVVRTVVPDASTPAIARSSAAFGRNTSVSARTSATPVQAPAGSQLVSRDVVAPAACARRKRSCAPGGEAGDQEPGRQVDVPGRGQHVVVDLLGPLQRDRAGQREDRPVVRGGQDDRQAGRRPGLACHQRGVDAAARPGPRS
jgi:hypothetical protein